MPVMKSRKIDSEATLRLELTQALLSAVTHFCRSVGVEQQIILDALHSPFGERTSQRVTVHHSELCMLPVVADMLRMWHSKPEFTDESGAPRALARTGTASLYSLAQMAHPTNPHALMASAFKFGALRCIGARCMPTHRSAYLGSQAAPALAYAAMVVARLTERIAENVSEPTGSTPRGFERTVSQSRLRAKDIPLFEKFVAEQGQLFVDTIDDWMNHHSSGSLQEGSLAVGVTAFAWSEGRVNPFKVLPAKQLNKRRIRKRRDL